MFAYVESLQNPILNVNEVDDSNTKMTKTSERRDHNNAPQLSNEENISKVSKEKKKQ